ncbi:MAG: hypothetical protein IKK73_00790 [Akkermansia sp.]|nr:hypothetical protein [Akkermansia sp.]
MKKHMLHPQGQGYFIARLFRNLPAQPGNSLCAAELISPPGELISRPARAGTYLLCRAAEKDEKTHAEPARPGLFFISRRSREILSAQQKLSRRQANLSPALQGRELISYAAQRQKMKKHMLRPQGQGYFFSI